MEDKAKELQELSIAQTDFKKNQLEEVASERIGDTTDRGAYHTMKREDMHGITIKDEESIPTEGFQNAMAERYGADLGHSMVDSEDNLKAIVINRTITKSEVDTNNISDGYHTFGELYKHRISLYIMLCNIVNAQYQHIHVTGGPRVRVNEKNVIEHKTNSPVWKSKKHSDGNLAYDGEWFVLGINYEAGKQITYHLPMHLWNEVQGVKELNQAPEYDGHTSADVLERLRTL